MIFMERTSIGRRVVIHRSEGKFLRAREESIEGNGGKVGNGKFPIEPRPLRKRNKPVGQQRPTKKIQSRPSSKLSLSPLLSIS